MGRWEGLMVDRMEGRSGVQKADQRVDRMEGRSGVQKADQMEGHLEDRMGVQKADQMEGHLGDRMGAKREVLSEDQRVVWEPPWAGRVVGMMLVVPGWFLSLPTPASTA